MKYKAEQSPPRLLFDHDGEESGNRTRQLADRGEERADDDSGKPSGATRHGKIG